MESRNSLETYIYNLKASYEDTLREKLPENDLEDLKTAAEDGLEVGSMRVVIRMHMAMVSVLCVWNCKDLA